MIEDAGWDLVLVAGDEEASGVLGAGPVAVIDGSLAQSRYGEGIRTEHLPRQFFLSFLLSIRLLGWIEFGGDRD